MVGKSLTTTPPGHFFGQPAVPRWSHATLVARPTGVLSFADERTRKVRDGGGRSVGSVRSYGDEEGEESGSEYGRSCMLAMRKDEEGDE